VLFRSLCKKKSDNGNRGKVPPVGLEKLFDDETEDISLIPEHNLRKERARQSESVNAERNGEIFNNSYKNIATLFRIKNFKKSGTHKN